MIAPRAVTEHAVDRYHQRWRSLWQREQAREELLAHLALSWLVERTPDGHCLWRTPRGAHLVVSHSGVVITVLPRRIHAYVPAPKRRRR